MREDTIIFWHRGNSWYLKVALEQAQNVMIILCYLETRRMQVHGIIITTWTNCLMKDISMC